MSAIFQRPLCEMGAAFDHAFRPRLGDPLTGSGGPCDDRPRPVELRAAGEAADSVFRTFRLCPEHEAQLRREDARLASTGVPTRFRTAALAP